MLLYFLNVAFFFSFSFAGGLLSRMSPQPDKFCVWCSNHGLQILYKFKHRWNCRFFKCNCPRCEGTAAKLRTATIQKLTEKQQAAGKKIHSKEQTQAEKQQAAEKKINSKKQTQSKKQHATITEKSPTNQRKYEKQQILGKAKHFEVQKESEKNQTDKKQNARVKQNVLVKKPVAGNVLGNGKNNSCIPYCGFCRNHSYSYYNIGQHYKLCRFRTCPCPKCTNLRGPEETLAKDVNATNKRSLPGNEEGSFSPLGGSSKRPRIESADQPLPNCPLCLNHNFSFPLKAHHFDYCLHKNCQCIPCRRERKVGKTEAVEKKDSVNSKPPPPPTDVKKPCAVVAPKPRLCTESGKTTPATKAPPDFKEDTKFAAVSLVENTVEGSPGTNSSAAQEKAHKAMHPGEEAQHQPADDGEGPVVCEIQLSQGSTSSSLYSEVVGTPEVLDEEYQTVSEVSESSNDASDLAGENSTKEQVPEVVRALHTNELDASVEESDTLPKSLINNLNFGNCAQVGKLLSNHVLCTGVLVHATTEETDVMESEVAKSSNAKHDDEQGKTSHKTFKLGGRPPPLENLTQKGASSLNHVECNGTLAQTVQETDRESSLNSEIGVLDEDYKTVSEVSDSSNDGSELADERMAETCETVAELNNKHDENAAGIQAKMSGPIVSTSIVGNCKLVDETPSNLILCNSNVVHAAATDETDAIESEAVKRSNAEVTNDEQLESPETISKPRGTTSLSQNGMTSSNHTKCNDTVAHTVKETECESSLDSDIIIGMMEVLNEDCKTVSKAAKSPNYASKFDGEESTKNIQAGSTLNNDHEEIPVDTPAETSSPLVNIPTVENCTQVDDSLSNHVQCNVPLVHAATEETCTKVSAGSEAVKTSNPEHDVVSPESLDKSFVNTSIRENCVQKNTPLNPVEGYKNVEQVVKEASSNQGILSENHFQEVCVVSEQQNILENCGDEGILRSHNSPATTLPEEVVRKQCPERGTSSVTNGISSNKYFSSSGANNGCSTLTNGAEGKLGFIIPPKDSGSHDTSKENMFKALPLVSNGHSCVDDNANLLKFNSIKNKATMQSKADQGFSKDTSVHARDADPASSAKKKMPHDMADLMAELASLGKNLRNALPLNRLSSVHEPADLETSLFDETRTKKNRFDLHAHLQKSLSNSLSPPSQEDNHTVIINMEPAIKPSLENKAKNISLPGACLEQDKENSTEENTRAQEGGNKDTHPPTKNLVIDVSRKKTLVQENANDVEMSVSQDRWSPERSVSNFQGECNVCSKVFHAQTSFRIHQYVKHDLDSESVPGTMHRCRECSFENKSEMATIDHESRHMSHVPLERMLKLFCAFKDVIHEMNRV